MPVKAIKPPKEKFAILDATGGSTETITRMLNGVEIEGRLHSNGGGFVAETAHVSETVFVGPEAMVLDNAEVYDNAKISGNARVSGNAKVTGNALVTGYAEVSGNAKVASCAEVADFAKALENARVFGDAKVSGNAEVTGNALVTGHAKVFGNARVYHDAQVFGSARVSGDAKVLGNAKVSGEAEIKTGEFACTLIETSEQAELFLQATEDNGSAGKALKEALERMVQDYRWSRHSHLNGNEELQVYRALASVNADPTQTNIKRLEALVRHGFDVTEENMSLGLVEIEKRGKQKQKEERVNRLLEEHGLEDKKENRELLDALMDRNGDVAKERVGKAFALIGMGAEVNGSTITGLELLEKAGLPVSPETVSQKLGDIRKVVKAIEKWPFFYPYVSTVMAYNKPPKEKDEAVRVLGLVAWLAPERARLLLDEMLNSKLYREKTSEFLETEVGKEFEKEIDENIGKWDSDEAVDAQ